MATTPPLPGCRLLLRKNELADLLSVTPRSIENYLRNDPQFPKPVRLGDKKTIRWRRADVEAYIAALSEAGGAA